MAEGDGVVNTGGIELWLTNDQGQLTKIKGVKRANSPHLEVDDVDTTDQDDGGVEDFEAGMARWPNVVVVMKHEPNSPSHQLILEHIASREKRPFKLVVPEEDGTTQDETGVILLKTYVPDDGTLGNLREATLTGRPGPITRADSV